MINLIEILLFFINYVFTKKTNKLIFKTKFALKLKWKPICH